MQLSKETIWGIQPREGLSLPPAGVFDLPEKVLQFGTGVLLRGLPDYFIDKANRLRFFNGRIVVVKSTSQGTADAFDEQDGLYTVCVKGIAEGAVVEETIVNSSISRVIAANREWDQVLKCARNPELKIIISNTTEVGIVLTDDDVHAAPPSSFPGKLLAVLLERYKAFYGREDSGMVIIPTELITDNGDKLRSIVVELARRNQLEPAFIQWLQSANHFCSSLVDRIVPGKLSANDQAALEAQLGCTDQLTILAEPFRLWAIQSASQRVREVLSFAIADESVVIAPDIEKFRELKLRLLNGTHTFSCGLAYLAGFRTVKEALANSGFAAFMQELMQTEIVPVLVSRGLISREEAVSFAEKVFDRFRNPFLDHQWLSISMNFTSKMRQRNLPLLLHHFKLHQTAPRLMSLGFAAYLQFMQCQQSDDGKYTGTLNGASYPIQDESAPVFAEAATHPDQYVQTILANQALWGCDLTELPGFADTIRENIKLIGGRGAAAVMDSRFSQKTVA